ncbi:MAG: DNA starvation/stationary phase protection protein [Coxiella sp. RIFCSPHIGHO2_12_FULL_42_15]|nr:MAG: DNA starvation/stationary phase protection protein [Coxiella sp. RIFCSPHIGHO2_12_FULL_42_15]
MSEKILTELSKLLSDTYALLIKTQNYHWHVNGPHFKSLHELFEEQYVSLATAVDLIAERIVTLGGIAPASFEDFSKLTSIHKGNSHATSGDMVADLYKDHAQVIKDMNNAIKIAQDNEDEGSISLLSERIAAHEKMRWMLGASK